MEPTRRSTEHVSGAPTRQPTNSRHNRREAQRAVQTMDRWALRRWRDGWMGVHASRPARRPDKRDDMRWHRRVDRLLYGQVSLGRRYGPRRETTWDDSGAPTSDYTGRDPWDDERRHEMTAEGATTRAGILEAPLRRGDNVRWHLRQGNRPSFTAAEKTAIRDNGQTR